MWATRPRPRNATVRRLFAFPCSSSLTHALPPRRGSLRVPHNDAPSTELQDLAGPLIRVKIRRLIGKAGLRQQDRSDLEQEVWTRLWPRLRAYDRRRGQPHGFLGTVIERILANLLRDRLAAKRDVRRVGSLPQNVPTAEGQAELGQTICQQEQDVRQRRSARSETEQVEMTLDVAEVMTWLPKDKQELVEQLQHHSLAEIARRTKVPRSTLQSQMRKLRQLFEDAGLRDYL
jgi:RNA polymerase sigma-70 factor (ECF subfamily)